MREREGGERDGGRGRERKREGGRERKRRRESKRGREEGVYDCLCVCVERERIVHSFGTDHNSLSRRPYLQSSIKVNSMAENGKTYLLQYIFSWNGALCQFDQFVLVLFLCILRPKDPTRQTKRLHSILHSDHVLEMIVVLSEWLR